MTNIATKDNKNLANKIKNQLCLLQNIRSVHLPSFATSLTSHYSFIISGKCPLVSAEICHILIASTCVFKTKEVYMARRGDPIKVMNRRLKEGRGKGHGAEYIPYIKVRDVPSRGFSTRVKGWKTGRAHHLLSNLEFNYFYYLEWAPAIIDIREQYPLPLYDTLKIADRLKIKHPTHPKTKMPVVMTTDFIVDIKTADGVVSVARSVKPIKELSSARVIEKLALERTFWIENGFDWAIVTEREIPAILAGNVEIIYAARGLENFPGLSKSVIATVESLLFKVNSEFPGPFAKSALIIDERLGLEAGTSLWIAKHLIANQIWLIDMSVPLNFSQPLSIARNESEDGSWNSTT